LKENLLAKFRGSSKGREEKREMEEAPNFVGRNKAERVFGEKLMGYNPPERKSAMPSSISLQCKTDN
jgi:hypothetical protein